MEAQPGRMGWTLRGGGALLPAAGAGLVSLLVYLRTLAPSIVEGDGAELVTAAYHAGVPHATGYPLYMLVGHGFTRYFPFGTVAFRMNLLSALFAALAVFLVCLLATRITRSRAAGVTAALLFGFSRTFWSQAVIAEVYALHVLFAAAVLLCAVTWDARGDRRWLMATAVVYGLSFTHHLSSILLAPALLYVALTSGHRGQFLRELRWTVPLFITPAVLYVYLPLAAWRNSPANWGDPSNLGNFLFHVTGREYGGRMFKDGLAGMGAQLARYAGLSDTGPYYLLEQFPLLLLPLAILGLIALFRRRRWFVLTLMVYVPVVFWAINYRIDDIEVYYLVAHLIVALWIAAGAHWLAVRAALLFRGAGQARLGRQALQFGRAASVLGLALVTGAANWSVNDRTDDWSTLTYARAALDGVKPNALVIADGDKGYFPLMYTRFVENRRPDVVLAGLNDLMVPARVRRTEPLAQAGITVRPPAEFLRDGTRIWNTSLLRQILADNVGERPVYLMGEPVSLLTHPLMWQLQEALAGYHRTAALNIPALELTREQPALDRSPSPVSGAGTLSFGRPGPDGAVGKDVELLGFTAEPASTGEIPWLRVRYYWRVHNPEVGRRVQVRVVFADAEGNYDQNGDGAVDLNNSHALGQGAAPGERDVRGDFRETFQVYVPPVAWNRPLYLWVALAADERPLTASNGNTRYTRVGQIPAVSMSGARLIAGSEPVSVPMSAPSATEPMTVGLR